MAQQRARARAAPRPKPSEKTDDDAASQERKRAQARFAELQEARRSSTRALDALKGKHAWEIDWSKYLLPAAEHVLDALSALGEDEAFWRQVSSAELSLAIADQDHLISVLDEVMDLDLVALLDLMKHTSPPPSYQVAINVQLALKQALDLGDGNMAGGRTADVRYQIDVFSYHLRPLIERAKAADRGTSDAATTGAEVAAALKRGAEALVPAALTAGIVGAVFPPAGAVGAAAVTAAGLQEAGKELTKKAVTLGSTAAIGAAFGNQDLTADLVSMFTAAEESFSRALGGVVGIAQVIAKSEELPPEYAQYAQAMSIEAVRWYHELERIRARIGPYQGSLQGKLAAEGAIRAITEFRDWVAMANPVDPAEWSELHDADVADLREVLGVARKRFDSAR